MLLERSQKRQNLRQSTNCSKGNKIERGPNQGYDSIGQEKKKEKKCKKNNIVTADQAWPGKSVPRRVPRFENRVNRFVFDVYSWGVYWFLDYRPRALKDLRDETHETLFESLYLSQSFFYHFIHLHSFARIEINRSNERLIFLRCG